MSALRQWRRSRDLTQRQLASLLGVTVQTVVQWERGKSEPSLQSLIKLQKITGLTARQLGYVVEVVL